MNPYGARFFADLLIHLYRYQVAVRDFLSDLAYLSLLIGSAPMNPHFARPLYCLG
jgi:hypothetical protein